MNARQMALEALKSIVALDDADSPNLWHFETEFAQARDAITELESDIAQPVEPFAEICDYERATDDDGRTLQYALVYSLPDTEKLLPIGTALFAAPQAVNAELQAVQHDYQK